MKRRRWKHPLYCPACRLRRRPGKSGVRICECRVPQEGATERDGVLMADVSWTELGKAMRDPEQHARLEAYARGEDPKEAKLT